MGGVTNEDYLEGLNTVYEFGSSLPKSGIAASEAVALRGKRVTSRNTNGSFTVSGGGLLIGRNFSWRDTKATTTSVKSYTFRASDFVDTGSPLLSEVVAALNAAAAEAAATVFSSGANGELVVTSAAAALDGVLSVHPGSANLVLGFPGDVINNVASEGPVLQITNGAGQGIVLTLPAHLHAPWAYSRTPQVDIAVLTVATGVKTKAADSSFTWVFTPSTRVLTINDVADASRTIEVRVRF